MLDKRGIRGILVDGFFPEFSTLKEIHWKKAMTSKMSANKRDLQKFRRQTFNKYLKEERATPNTRTQANVYREIIKLTRNRSPDTQRHPCVFGTYPACGYNSFEGLLARESKTKEGKIIRDSIPYMAKEFDSERKKGRDYFFDMSISAVGPGNDFSSLESFQYEWIDLLGFELKKENDYSDFQKYKKAVDGILGYFIDTAIRNRLIRPVGVH